ncbi:Dph6-related ATP pyrophosphatase [Fodinibius sp. AD559]|uniref:Dph6-related ATP pyrophosphatase n=1 Tax=Fodinibius sp. AD559 TaxID=3424179 RepID=UPI00404700A7
MNILFWSGGKDAYLALHFFRESYPEADLKLLTTYDESNDIVPHQNIPLSDIEEQTDHLGLDLISVGLPSNCPNETYLERIENALNELEQPIENLIFGDWYLEDIRQWREEAFGEMGYSCIFPIWKKDLNDLLPILLLKPIEIKISAVKEDFQSLLKKGESFDQKLVMQLQRLNEIDPMGENGEFHTKVIFKDPETLDNQPLIPGSR